MPLQSLWHALVGNPAGAPERRAALARRIRDRFGLGTPVSDAMFDDLFPWRIRLMSRVHWSPVRVAVRCAQLLAPWPGCRVLDIGSGVGKFCTIGALTTRGDFTGIEQYVQLVECAREVAGLLGASRAAFAHGLFSSLDPADYGSFYFYNPFEENDWPLPVHQPRAASFVRGTFEGGVMEARAFLRAAKPGARVVTYNGMGGELPSGYELAARDKLGCTVELYGSRPHASCASSERSAGPRPGGAVTSGVSYSLCMPKILMIHTGGTLMMRAGADASRSRLTSTRRTCWSSSRCCAPSGRLRPGSSSTSTPATCSRITG